MGMRLILIRHGEPDYSIDSLTEKGWREAKALADRIVTWDVMDFYTSDYGRAIATAKPALERLGRTAEILPWAHEFEGVCYDPTLDMKHLCWDYTPGSWTRHPENFRGQEWTRAGCVATEPRIAAYYDEFCKKLDEFIARYGYERDGLIYRRKDGRETFIRHTVGPDATPEAQALTEPETTVVLVCHLGAICAILSHLMNIPFMTLPHALYLPPSSVTVVNTEERWGDEVSFRAQCIGDVHHLLEAGESVSSAGAYTRSFQK